MIHARGSTAPKALSFCKFGSHPGHNRRERQGKSHSQQTLQRSIESRALEDERLTSDNESNQATARKPNPDKLKLKKVEGLGEESWAGVAAVDRGEGDASTSFGKAVLLFSGDLSAILFFTAIGRANHGESLDIPSLLKTAAPFLIGMEGDVNLGWFGAADLQKAFGREAQGGDVKLAAQKAMTVWATGIPVGLAVRTAQRQHLPDISFVLVTLVVTLVLLVGWRSALAAVTPDRVEALVGQRKDKRGNPLEFFQLLGSLTKRW